jgi:cytochrome oxidase Cu insertion factor (SCO1/SenC/PrrC family)
MRSLVVALSFTALGCGASAPAPNAPSAGSSYAPEALASSAALAPHAEVGKAAPDFTLTDFDGKAWTLRDLRGKVVVLEWFNPGCPFVKMSHTKGSLVGTAKRHMDRGVVWLAVNSAAPGKQGHGRDANAEARQRYGMEYPILVDESGAIGHAYGATNTPHMFVIDKEGVLIYRGAIDNSPDGEGQSPTGGKLVSYVDAALAALDAGRPVEVKETPAYGCSVKYAH